MTESRVAQTQVLALLVLVLVVAVVYAPVTTFGFVNQDDGRYLLNNPHVQQGLTLDAVGWSFTTLYFSNWHPLTWLSYLLDVQLFGIDPGAMHVVNLLLHVANTILLAWVLFRMTSAFWPAFAVAALFGLHPLHVESVAWISERKDVLSALFWLLAMLAYTSYVRGGGAKAYAAAWLMFCLGLLAKPMIVTLPCVLLLLDYWPLRRDVTWKRLVLEKMPFFVASAASAMITVLAQHRGGAVSSLDTLSWSSRIANAAVAYGAYLGKTVWPSRLSPFYPHPGEGIEPICVAVAATVLVAITACAFAMRIRKPYLLVGWLWYLGTLVPVIGLVQVGSQAMADRYTYIPLIGIFIAVAWLVWDLVKPSSARRRVAAACAIGCVAALSMVSARQVWIWRDSVALFSHALAVTEPSSAVHTNLGVALAEAGRFEDAIPHFEASLRMQPNSARTYYNLAVAHERLDEPDVAVRQYEQALELDPEYADAANNLGRILLNRGEIPGARAHFEHALRVEPQHLMARINLGDAFTAEHQWDEAASVYGEALRILPNFPLGLYRLARVRATQGRNDLALQLLDECLALNPDYDEAKTFRAELARPK